MTWHQVGTVFKELLEIGWRTNVFSSITAVLMLPVGLMENTRQSKKVWLLVKSVITGQATAVTGVTILQSGTVGLSSCMSYQRRLFVISVTVVTGAEVICFVCFYECQSRISLKQLSLPIIKQNLKTFSIRGAILTFGM